MLPKAPVIIQTNPHLVKIQEPTETCARYKLHDLGLKWTSVLTSLILPIRSDVVKTIFRRKAYFIRIQSVSHHFIPQDGEEYA